VTSLDLSAPGSLRKASGGHPNYGSALSDLRKASAKEKLIPCEVAIARALRASVQTEAQGRGNLTAQHSSTAAGGSARAPIAHI
jgi:hypothetical protein